MWIFTRYGFFSAVCARAGDGGHGQAVDPDRVMVRTRLLSHLQNLKDRFGPILADHEIQETVGVDYAYRLFVPKSAWIRIVGELTEEIDYDNFKSEVVHYQGTEGRSYENALHDVWSVMHRLQIRGEP